MIATRQATVTDAAWFRWKAKTYCRRAGTKENPEAAGWPSSKWRWAGGTLNNGLPPTDPTGTEFNSMTAGSEKVFEGPFRPEETIAFLRLVAGSTPHDLWEEPSA